jgi:hypothetical protein
MTWLEDVEAALVESVGFYDGVEEVMPEAFQTVFAAARRLVSLLGEGEKVEWCEEHKRPATETTCGSWMRKPGENYNVIGVTGCNVVSRLLVDLVRLEGED